MTSVSQPAHRKRRSRARIVLAVLLIVGVVTTLAGQLAGTRSRTPDAAFRYGFAVVPFLLLAVRLVSLRRSRAYETVVIVTAVFLWASSTMYTNDEMRLTYVLVPTLQIVVVVLVVVGLTLHNWLGPKFRRE
jgi:xanthine/uracil permease